MVQAALLSRLAWPPHVQPHRIQQENSSPQTLLFFRLAAAVVVLAGGFAASSLVVRPYLAGCASQRGETLMNPDARRALECHRRAVTLDPTRDLLWMRLAGCALKIADQCPDVRERHRLLAQAREATEEACRLVPVSGSNHSNRGRVLREQARAGVVQPAEVLAAFDDALRFDPENTAYLSDAAKAAITLGQIDRAGEYITRGLTLAPELGTLLGDLAAIALVQREYPRAEELLGKALAGQWPDVKEADRARTLLCLIYLDTGRALAALRLADDVLTRAPDQWAVRFLRGRALEKLGRRQVARSEYQRVIEVRPDHVQARDALKRLERLAKRTEPAGRPAGSNR
jgi:tetratricopeptide (TPR) repeat protein